MRWIVRFWICYVNNSWHNFLIVFVALVYGITLFAMVVVLLA
jgi:hypothetical protein